MVFGLSNVPFFYGCVAAWAMLAVEIRWLFCRGRANAASSTNNLADLFEARSPRLLSDSLDFVQWNPTNGDFVWVSGCNAINSNGNWPTQGDDTLRQRSHTIATRTRRNWYRDCISVIAKLARACRLQRWSHLLDGWKRETDASSSFSACSERLPFQGYDASITNRLGWLNDLVTVLAACGADLHLFSGCMIRVSGSGLGCVNAFLLRAGS